jgi:hypothetical protein
MPIPTPEPGLVISYAYLWHHEHEAGREEGRKDRPSVIVLAVERPANDTTVVVVLPITHTPPTDSASAVEIDYGFLPPRFFNQVTAAFAAWHRAHKAKLTSRE